ncbi:16101_t:CDS:2, partial [Acaulospora colombiana]
MLFNPGVGSGSGAGSSSHTRPHLPTPRKTYDGATIFATAATSDRCASPPPAVRHFTAPPGTLIHTHSSPNINQKHSPPTDWLYEESSSPSPTSYSSGCNSSHPPGTPSSSFNIESASEFCRQQQGYVSFGDIQGLGRPAGEEEEERLERERIELEMRRKKRL